MKLRAKQIEKYTKRINIQCFNRVGSTNTVAIAMAQNGADEGTAVTSKIQTSGRGRLGRSFLSKKGGVYFSVVLRPKISPNDTLFITVAAAVAACRAIEAVSGKKCEIKWVNDIYINGKKVCGILTEGGFGADGALDYAVLGVGINLFAPKGDFPDYLPLADSVFHKKDKILFKNRVKTQIIGEFANKFFAFYDKLQEKDYIKEYRQRSFLTGKEITFTRQEKNYKATVVGIDDDARLVINQDGKTDTLSHGEIQIVGMEQNAI